MNILIVSGSRNPEGQTARAVNSVLEGAKDAGSDVELVFLPALNLMGKWLETKPTSA